MSDAAAQPRISRSAEEVAAYRALHQLLDRPIVFDDPLALQILLHEDAELLKTNARRVANDASVRAMIAVRSRFAEDRLADAVRAGVRQYVILGAGLDTFAYRNSFAADGLRVFEVDHAAVQDWKRQRLAQRDIPVPTSVTYVPIDLTAQVLASELTGAGFTASEPAFFSMCGLVIFLPRDVVRNILKFVGTLPSGSAIVFDYGAHDASLEPDQLYHRRQAAKRSAAMGEPFVTFFDPPELVARLRQMGFSDVDDFGTDAMNARYLANRSDGLQIAPSGRRLLFARR